MDPQDTGRQQGGPGQYGQQPYGDQQYGPQQYGQLPYGEQPPQQQPPQQQYGQQPYGSQPSGPGPGPGQYDPNRPRPPRDEKDEKGQEKQEEKGQGLDEKYRRDPVGFVAFAVVIIWLGVTLLLRELEIISMGDKGWAVFAWGACGIFVVEALTRLGVPRWRRPIGGNLIWATVAFGVGVGLWFHRWEVIGPIVLIAVGVVILVSRLFPRR